MNSISWWIWSSALAVTAIRTQSNLFILLLICLFVFVVRKRRSDNGWGNPFELCLQLAAVALGIRMVFAVIVGTPMPGKVLFELPQLTVPQWLAGIRLGGAVTAERMQSVFSEGLKFAVIVIAFGAASALSSPIQVIKLISSRVYLFGVTLIIALSVLPQIINSFNRVITARRMRGLAKFKLINFRTIITPVLEESLERALDLSIAMESRGFGYHKKPTRYRPESFSSRDLITISISLYLLIFTPLLINSFGLFPIAALFTLFAGAPIYVTGRRKLSA